jgi:hypothetical protein
MRTSVKGDDRAPLGARSQFCLFPVLLGSLREDSTARPFEDPSGAVEMADPDARAPESQRRWGQKADSLGNRPPVSLYRATAIDWYTVLESVVLIFAR